MTATLECPGCHVELAYSPALLGRMVRCHHCNHEFPIAHLVDEKPEQAVIANGIEAALSLPRQFTPPPLPKRNSDWNRDELNRYPRRRPITGWDEQQRESEDSHSSNERNSPDSGAPAVVALVATLAFGVLVIATGIGYLAWPGSSRKTEPAIPVVAPPSETPLDVERPKNLNEVLGGGGKEVPPANPGFNPPGPPRRPGQNVPRPDFGAGPK